MGNIYDISKFKIRLKALRKKKNLTQESLKIADRRTISNWEKGNCYPSAEIAIELCNKLDCEFDYLFGKIDLPHKEETDIQKVTRLSEKAIEALCSLSPTERNLIDDLLSSANDLSTLALAYGELKILNKMLKDVPSDDSNSEWFKKTQGDLNYIRFTLSNNFSLFAERNISEAE